MAETESGIQLPEPDGERRCGLAFHNGKVQPVDLSAEELVGQLETFARDPQAPMFLPLVNPGHGFTFYLARSALDHIDFVDVRWIQVVRHSQTPPLWTPGHDAGPTVELHRIR